MSGATQTVEAYLYRLSLEDPALLGMFIGKIDIDTLRAFVTGYCEATRYQGDGFFEWLRDVANAFPGQGWEQHHLSLAGATIARPSNCSSLDFTSGRSKRGRDGSRLSTASLAPVS